MGSVVGLLAYCTQPVLIKEGTLAEARTATEQFSCGAVSGNATAEGTGRQTGINTLILIKSKMEA